jgi:hypothetical protein
MTELKIETRQDATSGNWYAELYESKTAASPIARTRAIFDSSHHATVSALAAIKRAFEQVRL